MPAGQFNRLLLGTHTCVASPGGPSTVSRIDLNSYRLRFQGGLALAVPLLTQLAHARPANAHY